MKYLFALFLLLGVFLASSPTTDARPGGGFGSRSGGGFRSGSFSSRPSYGGFRNSPSRTFTYRSSPAPTYSAPRTSYRSKTTVNHHYHDNSGGGSSGMGLMDYVILDNLMNRGHSPTYVNTQPTVVSGAPVSYGPETSVVYAHEESHGWRNLLLILLGVGLLYGIYRFFRYTLN